MTETLPKELASIGVQAPVLDVCIVNWRTAELVIDCLRSLEPEVLALSGCTVTIVDNDSGDGSAARIEEAIAAAGWGAWAKCLRAPTNGGFAAGNNFAIRASFAGGRRPDFVLLLNPDTIVRPGALQTLLDFARANPQVGIVGGLSEDLDATPQFCCFRFPNVVSEVSAYLQLGIFDRIAKRFLTRIDPLPREPRSVDWVSGALMLVRREVFDDIGGLDESYFLYYEETDFILRARRAGWPCWYVPQSRIVHLVGQSSGVTAKGRQNKRVPSYWYESRRRYFVLNRGRLYAAITDVCVIFAYLMWRCRSLLQRKDDVHPQHFLTDFIRHSAIVRGRGSLAERRTGLQS